jgi:hypothetical protein
MFFERKKALKRSVANRPLARNVRRNCDEQLALTLELIFTTNKINYNCQTAQNPYRRRQTTKCSHHFLKHNFVVLFPRSGNNTTCGAKHPTENL